MSDNAPDPAVLGWGIEDSLLWGTGLGVLLLRLALVTQNASER